MPPPPIQRAGPPTLLPLAQHSHSYEINTVLPPFPENPMKEDYLAAFATRERFAELFEPPAEGGKAFLEPVFEKNRRGGDRKISVLDSGRMVREQNKRQLKMMGKEMGMPRLSLKDPIVNSLTGPAASGRPLCNLVFMPEVDLAICNYLKKICSKMEAGCWLSAEGFEPVIFLAAQADVWQRLDPLRRAKAVLVAKDWVEDMEAKAAARGFFRRPRPGQMLGRGVNSLAHTPSLTTRQSRRCGVSAMDFKARWA